MRCAPERCIAMYNAYWSRWLASLVEGVRAHGFMLTTDRPETLARGFSDDEFAGAVAAAFTDNEVPDAAQQTRLAEHIRTGRAHRTAYALAGAASAMGFAFTTQSTGAESVEVSSSEFFMRYAEQVRYDMGAMLEEMARVLSVFGLYFVRARGPSVAPLHLASPKPVARAMYAIDARRDTPRLSAKELEAEVAMRVAEGGGNELLAAGLEVMREAGYEIAAHTDERARWDRSDLSALYQRFKWHHDRVEWHRFLEGCDEALTRCGLRLVEDGDAHAKPTQEEVVALGQALLCAHLRYQFSELEAVKVDKTIAQWTREGLTRLSGQWLLGALADNGLFLERIPS